MSLKVENARVNPDAIFKSENPAYGPSMGSRVARAHFQLIAARFEMENSGDCPRLCLEEVCQGMIDRLMFSPFFRGFANLAITVIGIFFHLALSSLS
jgi:hypothetical protein